VDEWLMSATCGHDRALAFAAAGLVQSLQYRTDVLLIASVAAVPKPTHPMRSIHGVHEFDQLAGRSVESMPLEHGIDESDPESVSSMHLTHELKLGANWPVELIRLTHRA
jgi:hypothetical protein